MRHVALMVLLDAAIIAVAIGCIHVVETVTVRRIERQIDADTRRRQTLQVNGGRVDVR